MRFNIITRNVNETFQLGRKIATGELKELVGINLFLLKGELGGGKTSFVKGFCSHWEVDNLVSSPSFTIVNEYVSDKIKIFHIDLFRIGNVSELEEIGISELISESDFTFIEWPELIEDFIERELCLISFSYGEKENERIIFIEKK